MEALQATVNGLAIQLLYLGIWTFVFMTVTAIMLRLLQKVIKIHREIRNFLLTLAGLGAFYVWIQITFM